MPGMLVNLIVLLILGLCLVVKSDLPRYQKKPVFIRIPEDSYPLRRKQLSLRCQATGYPIPDVTWYKDGEIVQTQRDKPGTSNRITRNWELFFLSFSEEDEGEYYCNASNSVGWTLSPPAVVRTAYLSIENAVGPESKVVSLGDPVMLECVPPTGLPKPSISWVHNEKPITLDSRISISETGDLKIAAVSQLDSGTYQCCAENIAGSWRSTLAQLTVQPRPRFKFTPGNKQVLVGGNVEFHCMDSDDPNSTVLWRRDSDHPKTSLLNRKSLRIEDVHLSDAGNYVCEVQSLSGKLEAVAHLSVISPPSFVITPDDHESSVGDDVYFDCLTSGTPAPTVRWMHKGKTFWVPNHFQRVFEGGKFIIFPNGTLLVKSVSAMDEGAYECKASQLAGIVKSSAYLSIKFSTFFSLPLIELGPQNQTLQVGMIATLPCHSTVVRYPFREGPLVHSFSSAIKFPPELTIDWLINGNRASSFNDPRIVSFHSGSLQINAVRMTDAGTYTCRAEVDDFNFPHTTRSTMWSAFISVSETDANDPTVSSASSRERQPIVPPPPPDKVLVVEVGDTWVILEVAYLRNFTSTSDHDMSHSMMSSSPSGLRVEMAEYNKSSSWQIVIPFVVTPRIKVNNLKPRTGYFFLVRGVKAGTVGRPMLLERLVYTTDPVSVFTNDPAILSAKLQLVEFSPVQLRSISPSEVLAEFKLCGPLDSLSVVTGFRATARVVPLSNCLRPDAEFGYTILDQLDDPRSSDSLCSVPTSASDPDFFDAQDQLPHCSLMEPSRNVAFDRSPPQFLNKEHFVHLQSLNLKPPNTVKFVVDGLRPFLCYSFAFEAMATHVNSGRFFNKKSPSSSVLTYDSPPSGAPKVTLVRWLQNGTVLDITWQPPAEWEQGGFLIGYTLWVLSASSSNQNFRVGSEQRSFLLRSLDVWTNYTIYLAAENCRGEGIRSLPVHVFAPTLTLSTKVGISHLPPDSIPKTMHRRIIYDGREATADASVLHHLDAANVEILAPESPEEENLTREPWFIISVVAFVLLWILIVLGLILCGRHRSRTQRRRLETGDTDVATKNGRLVSATDLYPIHSWPSSLPQEAHPLVSNFDCNPYVEKTVVGNGYPSMLVQPNGLLPGISFGPSSMLNGNVQATIAPGFGYNSHHSTGPQGAAYAASCNIPTNVTHNGISRFQALGPNACVPDSRTAVLPHSISVPPNGQVPGRYDHTSPKDSSRSGSNTDDAVTPYASVPVMQQMLFFDQHTNSSIASGDRSGAGGRQLSLAEIIPPPPDYPPPSLPSGSPVLPSTAPVHPTHWLPADGSGSGEDSAYYAHSELQPSLSQQTNQSQQHRIPTQWSCSTPASDENSTLLPHVAPSHRTSQPAIVRNSID